MMRSQYGRCLSVPIGSDKIDRRRQRLQVDAQTVTPRSPRVTSAPFVPLFVNVRRSSSPRALFVVVFVSFDAVVDLGAHQRDRTTREGRTGEDRIGFEDTRVGRGGEEGGLCMCVCGGKRR